jgi:hypothetical protein
MTTAAKYMLQLKDTSQPNPGTFYLTVKVHKNPPASRPIVNTRNTPTYYASKYLHYILAPVMKRCGTYTQNSKDIITSLENLTFNREVYLLSADVKELYPSIPIKEGLATLYFILLHRMKWPLEEAKYITELTQFVLTNNVFKYKDTLYLQTNGTAMGTCCACAYATIYLHGIEERIKRYFTTNLPIDDHPILVKRYIDDIFAIFYTKKGMAYFLRLYNHATPTIQLDTTGIGDNINVLDLTIYKGPRFATTGILDIKLFQKDMNLYLYIPPDSYHTPATIKGFITTELQRYRINCSSEDNFISSKLKLYQRLLDRHYTPAFLDPIFDVQLNRQHLLNRSATTTQIHTPTVFLLPRNPRFPHKLLKHLIQIPTNLMEHPAFNLFNNQQPIVGYKRTQNLKDLIIKHK